MAGGLPPELGHVFADTVNSLAGNDDVVYDFDAEKLTGFNQNPGSVEIFTTGRKRSGRVCEPR